MPSRCHGGGGAPLFDALGRLTGWGESGRAGGGGLPSEGTEADDGLTRAAERLRRQASRKAARKARRRPALEREEERRRAKESARRKPAQRGRSAGLWRGVRMDKEERLAGPHRGGQAAAAAERVRHRVAPEAPAAEPCEAARSRRLPSPPRRRPGRRGRTSRIIRCRSGMLKSGSRGTADHGDIDKTADIW
jgi:hypothetical protein